MDTPLADVCRRAARLPELATLLCLPVDREGLKDPKELSLLTEPWCLGDGLETESYLESLMGGVESLTGGVGRGKDGLPIGSIVDSLTGGADEIRGPRSQMVFKSAVPER